MCESSGNNMTLFQMTPLLSVAPDTAPVGAQDLVWLPHLQSDLIIRLKKKSCEKMWVV